MMWRLSEDSEDGNHQTLRKDAGEPSPVADDDWMQMNAVVVVGFFDEFNSKRPLAFVQCIHSFLLRCTLYWLYSLPYGTSVLDPLPE